MQGYFLDFCDQKCGKFPLQILVISTQTVWLSQHNTSVQPGIYRGNCTSRWRKVPAFHRTQRSMLYSDQAATWPSPQPDQFSSSYPILFKFHFNIILPSITRPSKWNCVCVETTKWTWWHDMQSVPNTTWKISCYKKNRNMSNYLLGSPAHGTLACDPIHPVGQHHACVHCNKSIKYAAQRHTTQVQSQSSLRGICELPSDNETKSSPSASVFPCQYHPTNALY